MRREKDPEVFEALTLFLGPLGVNWLYLGRTAPLFTRCFHLGSALVLLITGASFLNLPLALGGLVFLLVVVSLWITDYVRRERALDADHDKVHRTVVLHTRGSRGPRPLVRLKDKKGN